MGRDARPRRREFVSGALGDLVIATFKWVIGEKAPDLKSHSGAKLRLIEHYLDAYFDAVIRNPTIERFRITLVDGFCGGGAFTHDGLQVEGTPFLLLKAVERAEYRLNLGKAKPLKIDAQFHFVDKSKKATDFLKDQLLQKGYLSRLGHDIFVHTAPFDETVPRIASDIAARTARGTGRSLFLLDQKGYTTAPVATIRAIFDKFSRAECILTFAVDWLIDYLTDKPETVSTLAPVELSAEQLREFLKCKEEPGGRYVIQRLLLKHLHQRTGAEFATPFFIKSREAKKDLWLVHLSRHSTARNVMVDSHWSVKNHSIHHGVGGLEISGFDPDIAKIPDFMFADHERMLMHEKLAEDMIRRLQNTAGRAPVVYGSFVDSIANETPARLSDIDAAIHLLGRERELEILNADGKIKRTTRPGRKDQLFVSLQPSFNFG